MEAELELLDARVAVVASVPVLGRQAEHVDVVAGGFELVAGQIAGVAGVGVGIGVGAVG